MVCFIIIMLGHFCEYYEENTRNADGKGKITFCKGRDLMSLLFISIMPTITWRQKRPFSLGQTLCNIQRQAFGNTRCHVESLLTRQ